MKKIFSYLTIAILLVAGVSCNKNLEQPSLILNVTELEVDPSGGETTVGVKCNRDWVATIEADCDWITLTPSSAEAFEASSYMILRADANEDYDRSAVITVATKAGDLSATLTVYQSEDGLVIKDADQFYAYMEAVAAGEIPAEDVYKLGDDIDLDGVVLPAVAEYNNKFDGRGRSLLNWAPSAPLFAKIGGAGEFANVELDASCVLEIGDTGHFGFITAENNGRIEGVINNAPVLITAMTTTVNNVRVAPICGVNKGTISACENYGDITYAGAPDASKNVTYGAIAGETTGDAAKIEECYNAGNMTFTFNAKIPYSTYVAGIAGWLGSNSHIVDCENDGNITITAPGSANMVTATGIVSYAGGEVSGCVNNGAITYLAESSEGAADGPVQRTGVAGITAFMGWQGKTVSNNHNYGEITFRGGYLTGYTACGGYSKYAANVAGLYAVNFKCGVEDCTNSGVINFTMADIDNASAWEDASNPVRQANCGGIVASTWGNVSNCINSETINIVCTGSKPVEGTARAAVSKKVGFQVGGITGGDYNSSDKKQTSIIDCVNEGAINVITDAAAYNNSIGGISGYPMAESSTAITTIISGCENSGDITVEGYGLTRIAGIAACANMKDNVNYGKLLLNSGSTGCTIGGISAVLAGGTPVLNCENYGEIESKVKIAGAQGGASAGIGGIVGASYNQANSTIKGCTANCNIVAPEGSTAYMLVGVVGSNKAATTVNVFGTEESPNYVAGSIKLGSADAVTLTSENFASKALAPITSNTNISTKILFAE